MSVLTEENAALEARLAKEKERVVKLRETKKRLVSQQEEKDVVKLLTLC